MYLENRTVFNEFLVQNESFWTEHGGASISDRCIYVDLAHDNPAYLLTNLWIAKYLQRHLGTRIVGLIASWPKSIPHFDADAVKALAASFLIDEVRDIDDPCFNDPDLLSVFKTAVGGLDGAKLRGAILSFGKEIDPDIGWILYDSWIRQERIGTCETVSDELFECARRVLRARRGARQVMSEGLAAASVVGHYHYSPYAWIARETVSVGAPVYFQSLLLPVSIRRFSTLDDFRRGRSADFVEQYETNVVAALSNGQLEAFSRRMFDVQGGVRQFFRKVHQGAKVESRETALQGLGLNAQLPTVGIYVPALCGPPHCFGPLAFDDNGDWLRKTLDIAVDTSQVNFVVKGHPQDATYDTLGLMARFAGIYGQHPNIRFLDELISPNQVAEMIDLAVTVSGTPGYELAVRGVRTLAAGPSRYTGLGFSVDATTLDIYHDRLATPGRGRLDGQAIQAALAFMFFEMSAGRSQALFLPALRLAPTAEFWVDGVRRLSAGLPEEDPLWRNLSHMVVTELPFLLNIDIVPTAPTMQLRRDSVDVSLAGLHAVALTARRCADESVATLRRTLEGAEDLQEKALVLTRALLSQERRIRFGLRATGNVFLCNGWSVPEEGGVWTDGPRARIQVPALPSGTFLLVDCAGFVTEASPERRVVMQCEGSSPVAATFRFGDGFHQIRLLVGEERTSTEILFFVDNPDTPVGGERRLGLWLKAISIEKGE